MFLCYFVFSIFNYFLPKSLSSFVIIIVNVIIEVYLGINFLCNCNIDDKKWKLLFYCVHQLY